MSEVSIAETTLQHPPTQVLLKKSRGGDVPEELRSKQSEFEAIYEKLPIIAQKLLAAYKEVLTAYKLNPGEVRLYMVGGRVKDKPLKEDSDIDLIFSVANKKQSPGTAIIEGYDPTESQDYQLIMMGQIKNKLSTICAEQGVINHFHILEYGTAHPQHEVDSNQAILLGTL